MNISAREKEMIRFWKERDIFKKTLEKKSPQGDYVFYDGPPFATGLPHYGHILSSVIKDVVPRYWTMKGYHVRRRWGWDCHGLPIENIVEQKLGVSGKRDIEETVGIEQFNETCRQEVLTYVAQWRDMIERIGRWVEFDNAYRTMDSTYMESVWWALKQLWNKQLIYEGRKVLLYCPRCETPVSKFEVAMDHSYKDVTETAVTVKFKLKPGQKIGDYTTDDRTFALAWTTTPWTLSGNVALAVGSDIKYMSVTVADLETDAVGLRKGETYFFTATEDADKRILAIEARHPKGDDSIADVVVNGKKVGRLSDIRDFRGQDVVGLEYEPLFDIPAVRASGKKAHYIAAADFVSTEEGTGVVHTAVIYGEDDFNLGMKIGLPMIPLLDSKGRFNSDAPEFIRGKQFKESEKFILGDLEKRKLLFKKEGYTHAYPHCWRCDSALFYNAIDAWFINIQTIKHRLVELNEQIRWYPEHLKHGRFLNIVKEAPDWNISRNRYWATALPFWKCEKTECRRVICIGSVLELKQSAVNFGEVYPGGGDGAVDLHKHVIDKIKLRCECGGEMSRVSEVIDCWVESASMPFAEYHYPFENEAVFKGHFPGDYIAEYISQTRTWFYYMHVLATALFDSISFRNVVTTGTILNEKGEKMSKSKRNFHDPWEVINAYGADALRFHLMNSVLMQAENLNYNEKEVNEIFNKVVNTIYNVVSFYKLYPSNMDGFDSSQNVLDRWVVALSRKLIGDVTASMDRYETVQATRAILNFVQELSTWYVRRSRDRFKDDHERTDAARTLKFVLNQLARLAAPFIPMTAEHIWQELKMDEAESVHLAAWPVSDSGDVDEKLLADMQRARVIVEKAHALRAAAGIKVRQPLQKLETVGLPEELRSMVADEVNVKEVAVVAHVHTGDGIVVDESSSIALYTAVNEELKAEGALREIIRMTNALRKKKGLKPGDAVEIVYETASEFLRNQVIGMFHDQLAKATVATRWRSGSGLPHNAETASINGEKLTIHW